MQSVPAPNGPASTQVRPDRLTAVRDALRALRVCDPARSILLSQADLEPCEILAVFEAAKRDPSVRDPLAVTINRLLRTRDLSLPAKPSGHISTAIDPEIRKIAEMRNRARIGSRNPFGAPDPAV